MPGQLLLASVSLQAMSPVYAAKLDDLGIFTHVIPDQGVDDSRCRHPTRFDMARLSNAPATRERLARAV
jgi:hypothetical protein